MTYIVGQRSPQTLSIESMLLDGNRAISEIARIHNVSRARVQFIQKRVQPPATPVAPHQLHPGTTLQSSGMKTLNLHLTPAVYKALVEATAISNTGSDEPSTIEDYAGDVVITHLQTLGLIRQKRK
jgi:hypothetical protein